MEWEVIPWEVEDEFELIMNLIQETGNASGTSFQAETRLEVCLRMMSAYNRITKGEASLSHAEAGVVWKSVVAEAQQGDHAFNDELPALSEFLMVAKSSLLKKLVDYQKTLKFAPRVVSSSVMQNVMAMALGDDGRGHVTFRLDPSFITIIK